MNSATSERPAVQGFNCENMGDVLGKEGDKDVPLLDQPLAINGQPEVPAIAGEENAKIGPSIVATSKMQDDEDVSWLLSLNTEDLNYKKCKCEGCLRRFISFSTDEKNARNLLSSWKEFKEYMRNVYINPPFDSVQQNHSALEDNKRLPEIIQVLQLCDPYQLLKKIESEVITIVLESRSRLLGIMKNGPSNQQLAEIFVTGLIEEYVKLLLSALYLGPAIDVLLGPQLQKFGLTWEVLNKHLYLSLIYLHKDVQEMWPMGFDQLKNSLSSEDDFYHELFHQYITLDHEMNLVETTWKSVEPLIQEYRTLKSKENETLKTLQAALKACFLSNKQKQLRKMAGNEELEHCATTDDCNDFCSDCMSRRDCRCNECLMTHLMVCEKELNGGQSESHDCTPDSSRCGSESQSRSRSRSSSLASDERDCDDDHHHHHRDSDGGQGHSCECHACTEPPSDLIGDALMDFETIDNAGSDDNFSLYPHIHGTTAGNYSVSRSNPCLSSAYSHLYSVLSGATTNSKEPPSLLLKALTGGKVHSKPRPAGEASRSSSTLFSGQSVPISIPKDIPVKSAGNLTSEQLAFISKAIWQRERDRKMVNSYSNSLQVPPSPPGQLPGAGGKKALEVGNSMDENLTPEEVALVKKALNQNQPRKKVDEKPVAKTKTASACLKPGVCNKCAKHGSQPCGKSAEKHLAAIARLGLSKYAPRPTTRCAEHAHNPGKPHVPHTCTKGKGVDDLSNNRVSMLQTEGDLDCDDSSSFEDTCSERSNSTSTSNSNTNQKDPKHCDCCYCEVFGHGVAVAPVSRNYQEMRERLRLRLNMKKKSKPPSTATPAGQPPSAKAAPVTPVPPKAVEPAVTKEQDLDSLLQFIEGNGKEECIDEKRAAKRARQKQKKQEEKEEKERQEREAERLRLEALKKMNKKSRKAALKMERLEAKRALAPPAAPTPPKIANNSPLTGWKNVVVNSPTGAEPKMVTIRRVMEPFSAEPTVTITIKGSTPDKDQVLFTLNNRTTQPAEVAESGKAQKKKRKGPVEPPHEEPSVVNSKSMIKNKKGSAVPPAPASVHTQSQNQRTAAKNGKTTVSAKSAPVPVKTAEKKNAKNSSNLIEQPIAAKGNKKPLDVKVSVSVPPQPAASMKPLVIKDGKVVNGVREKQMGGNPQHKKECEVTVTPIRGTEASPVYRLSEVLNCIAPTPQASREEISLENLRLPPGITITKIEGPVPKTIRAGGSPGPVSKPVPTPLVVTHPSATAKATPGNVIVVDTGHLKQVMKGNAIPQMTVDSADSKKKKKKKKKASAEPMASQTLRQQTLDMSEQATIIKTSGNMVTIRSPQLQHAIDMQAHAAGVNGLSDGMQRMQIDSEDCLSQQMTRLSLADARASVAGSQSVQEAGKKKKKRRGKGNGGDEDVDQLGHLNMTVKPCTNRGGLNFAESVFQPKDIDLESGEMDDDERELEAFKRFCLQSVPSARKDKVKVNLNIKDIVLKKKSSAIGCS